MLRGSIRFDCYQQVITPVDVKRIDRQGARLLGTVIDRVTDISQGQTWK